MTTRSEREDAEAVAPITVAGWDHDRCMRPLRAAADEWHRLTGVAVECLVRSGDAFAGQPIREATQGVDLVCYDHPFVGQAAVSGALLPFEDLLPEATLRALAADSIGLSHESYRWAGRQWGLAVDAACQVSVIRPDLLSPNEIPATWDAALELARRAPGRVTTALTSHDAICTLLTLCASQGSPITPSDGHFADPGAALTAIDWLTEFASCCHDSAWRGFIVKPMTESDQIIYGLLQWGYTDYSRRAFAGRTLRFVDIPQAGPEPTGSTLGGAGLGVSAASAQPEQAAAFAAWMTSTEVQRGLVYPNGGQPGSATAWRDAEIDHDAGGFFSGTIETITRAELRPRAAWWPTFQHRGGAALVAGLHERAAPHETLARIEAEYQKARTEHEPLPSEEQDSND